MANHDDVTLDVLRSACDDIDRQLISRCGAQARQRRRVARVKREKWVSNRDFERERRAFSECGRSRTRGCLPRRRWPRSYLMLIRLLIRSSLTTQEQARVGARAKFR